MNMINDEGAEGSMNTEQERAAFEAWAASIGFSVAGKYAETIDVLCAESAFKAGYQAGRAALEAVREDAEPVVRFNDDGTLDEVVGRGQFHLEQMGSGHWWMQLGPHIVNLSARGKIRAHFGRNEAAIDQARGKGGKEDGND